MDASDQQSSKTVAPQVASSIGTCRLRNGLNDDCLLKIMEFLNIHDLMQLCDTDTHYKDLMTKWIIGKRLFNFREIMQTSNNDILNRFGKHMRKIVIYEPDFPNFLRTIIKWCDPDTLTEVKLNFERNKPASSLSQIPLHIPILSNIRKFSLNMAYQQCSTFDNFMTALLSSAANLTHLHLFRVDMKGDWLEQKKMLNLCDLRIISPVDVSVARLEIFLSCLPKLHRFTYEGETDIISVGTTLLEKCPNLEVFEDAHGTYLRKELTAMTLIKTRYNFLASFANLNTVTLTSYTCCCCDLYHALTKLAHRNIVHLKVFVRSVEGVSFNEAERRQILQNCSFSHFVSMSSLELDIQFRSEGTIRCEFLLLFARQLKNLEKFKLKSRLVEVVNIEKIIEPLLSQIRTLSISHLRFRHLPVEMRKIVRILRAIRIEDRPVLKLIVNIEQWRELQVYKDIDKLTEMVIDH